MCDWPGHVIKGMKMPGQLGCETVSTKNLKIAEIKLEENLLLIEGAVPGNKGSLVYVYTQDPKFLDREELKPKKDAVPEETTEAPQPEKKEAVVENKEADKTKE